MEGQVGAVMPGALAAAPCATVLCAKGAALAKAGQRRVGGVRDNEDVTAAAPVATVRAAVGNVLLAAEADSPPPA
jgi:hypothetical protein